MSNLAIAPIAPIAPLGPPTPTRNVPADSLQLRRLLVKDRDRTIVVHPEDVEWIGAAANYVELNLPRRSYLMRATLDSLERRLDPSRFLRVHRNAIVNLAAVVEIDHTEDAWALVLKDGRRLVVARNRQERVLAWLACETEEP